MTLTPKTQKLLLIIYGIGILALSIYALFYYIQQRAHLVGNDPFYYMSIADSVRHSGQLLDLTTNPGQPVMTPQNGIALVFLLIGTLGLAPEAQLVTVVILNYLLHLTGVYPLYWIARRIGLTGVLPLAALLGLYLGTWHMYRAQLAPLNDGVFNALSLWLVYLIIQLYDDLENGVAVSRRWGKFMVAIILTTVAVHFRMQILVTLGAALLAPLVTRRYRTAPWIAGLVAAGLVSLALVYFPVTSTGSSYIEVNSTDVSQRTDRHLSADFLAMRLRTTAPEWVGTTLPDMLLADGGLPANLIYVPFGLALALALLAGLRQQETALLFISGLSMAGILAAILVLAPRERYLLYTLPFLYLLLLLSKHMRLIGYLFIILALVATLARFASDIPRSSSRFWLYLHEQQLTLPGKAPLLISEKPRYTYFFLGTSSYNAPLTWEVMLQHQELFLVGSAEFVSDNLAQVEQLAETNGYTFKRRNLIPDYQDDRGATLLELYDFTAEKVANKRVEEPMGTDR